MKSKPSILFLDTYNITRSIIAESYFRKTANKIFNIYSAGTFLGDMKTELFQEVYKSSLETLSELMLPIIGLKPYTPADKYANQHFEYVIIMSDHAEKNCPMFIGTTIKMYWRFKTEETFDQNISKNEMLERLRVIRLEVINEIKRMYTPTLNM